MLEITCVVLQAYDHKLSAETIWFVHVRNLFTYIDLIQKYNIKTNVKAAVLTCKEAEINV
jgi:hypothetical protein